MKKTERRTRAGIYLGAMLVLASFLPNEAVAQAPPAHAATDARLTEFIEAWNGGEATLETYFTEAFSTTQSDMAFLRQRLRQRGVGSLEVIERVEQEALTVTANMRSALTDGWFELTLKLDEAESEKIAAFTLLPIDTPESYLTSLSASDLAGEINSYVERLADAGLFSGTILVAHDDDILVEIAVGVQDRDTGEAIRIDTQFDMGSANKIWTATTALSMVEKGVLDLHEPIGTYLPDYPSEETRSKVTLHHLLTHSAGMGDYFSMSYMQRAAGIETIADYMELLEGRSPEFDPGSRVSYSNAGLVVVAAVIEAASGRDYFEMVQERVMDKARMTLDPFPFRRDNTPNIATGYTRMMPGPASNAGADGRQSNARARTQRPSPAGGAKANVYDLLRFTRALDSNRLLRSETTDLMLTPKVDMSAVTGYGYGTRIAPSYGMTWLGHGGGGPGINAEMLFDRDSGYTIIVLANYDPDSATTIAAKIKELLARVIQTNADES